jgi:LmbE family N-acetylglucosaminyl deacetylase
MSRRRAAARAADRIAATWRGRLTARATDATAAVAGRNLLVVAPHPDDETFGCGALIARARAAGTPVTVVVATDGARSTVSAQVRPAELAALRRAELHEACARLGVTDVVELGHRDGSLTGLPGLTAELAELVASRRPGVVLTPCAQDPHPDHAAVHHATVAALAGVPTRPVVLSYPVWTWHAGPFFRTSPAGRRLRLQAWAARQLWSAPWWRMPADGFAGHKERAVAAYRSQITNLTGEPCWSYLAPDFVRLFLGPDELLLPVRGPAIGRPHAKRVWYVELVRAPVPQDHEGLEDPG